MELSPFFRKFYPFYPKIPFLLNPDTALIWNTKVNHFVLQLFTEDQNKLADRCLHAPSAPPKKLQNPDNTSTYMFRINHPS